MKGAQTLTVGAVTYELDIAIGAPPARVWEAIVDETNAWWLPDFHMVAPNSKVTFDVRAGGSLIEHSDDGGSLLWLTVLWCRPKELTLHTVGHIAPQWGGPATSLLTLAVEPGSGGGSVLKVTDAHHGHVDEANIRSLQDGWTELFSEGLKAFVEQGTRHDR